MEGVLSLDSERQAASICRVEGLPFVSDDVITLPIVPACLDVVRAKEVIEHITDAMSMLREVHRVPRPGGLFRCQVPSQSPPSIQSATFGLTIPMCGSRPVFA